MMPQCLMKIVRATEVPIVLPCVNYYKNTMGDLSRIGVAIDSDLLARFDRFISKQGYTNRSEAFRDLVRDRLVAAHVIPPRHPQRHQEQPT